MSLASREKVTAVVVTSGRDFAYARSTLDAIAHQSHLPTQTILVATAPLTRDLSDNSRHEVLPNFSFISAQGVHNFAQAVNVGLKDVGDDGWIWLLHADSAPQSEALDHLLRAGEHSPATAIVGAKQVSWDANTLLEVGIRATRSARRVPEVVQDERDQGQLDSRSDVLAVGTAGMLVRAKVWNELGGLNPDFGPFGDGLEFSRRVRLAGHRVVVVPSAVVRHAQLSLPRSFAQRRRAQLVNSLIAAPSALMPVLWLGYILGAPIRAMIRLAMKEPQLAVAELRAGVGLLGSFGAVSRGRAALPSHTVRSLGQLEDSPRDVRAFRREAKRSAEEAQMLALRPSSLELKARAELKERTHRMAVLALILGIAVTCILHLKNLTSGVLVGGSLAQDTHTASELWQIMFLGWSPVGDGSSGGLDPFWSLMIPFVWIAGAAGGTLAGVATFIHVISPVLAALAAFRAAGVLTTSAPMRLIAAVVWITAPPFLEAQTFGFLAASVIHVLLPLAVSSFVRAWRGQIHQIFALALVSAVLTAATPIFVVIGIVLSITGLAARRRQRLRWGWVALPSLTVFASSWSLATDHPAAFWLSTPGVPALPGGGQPATTLWDFFASNSVTSQPSSWLLLCGPIVVVCTSVLCLVRHTAVGRWGWMIAAVGFALAGLSLQVNGVWVASSSSFVTTGTLPQVGLSVAWLGFTLAVLAGTYKLRSMSRGRAFGVAQAGALTLVVALVGSSLVTATTWAITHRFADALDSTSERLPAIAQPLQSGNNKQRVLALIATDNAVRGEVWRRDGIEMSQYSRLSRPVADTANTELAQAIADLAAGSTSAMNTLKRHNIGLVLVPASKTTVHTRLLASLGANSGLEFIAQTQVGTFWRVFPAPARVTLDGEPIGSGVINVHTDIRPSREGVVRLAERTDPRFVATLDGEPLKRADDPWANAWMVPAHPGKLEIKYDNPAHRALVAVTITMFVFTAIGALPIWRRKGVTE